MRAGDRTVAMPATALTRRSTVAAALVVVLLGLSGCGGLLGGPNPPHRFYVLTAEVPDTSRIVIGPAPTVGIERVSVADYLDRTGFVTRADGNRVDVAEFDQWAEPLDRAITTVLAETLTAMIPSDRVTELPTSRAIRFDYRVAVAIVRFDAGPDNVVHLIARWAMFDGEQREELAFGRFEIERPVDVPAPLAVSPGGETNGPDKPYGAIAAAMSEALAGFSEVIATEIRGLDARRPRSLAPAS